MRRKRNHHFPRGLIKSRLSKGREVDHLGKARDKSGPKQCLNFLNLMKLVSSNLMTKSLKMGQIVRMKLTRLIRANVSTKRSGEMRYVSLE